MSRAFEDRYGNPRGTASAAAFDAYCEGIDLLLTAQPGGIQALQRAVAEDPAFAVAYADLARALQIEAQPKPARAAIDRARELLDALRGAERGHVEIMGLLLDGQGEAALSAIGAHLREHPRDVMTLVPCCGVFGLIGFSGRVGREAENAAFMTALVPHYDGDWWFDSQFAFALSEIGQHQRAEALLERSLALRPDNANTVHHLAHLHYETGAHDAGRAALARFRSHYDRSALLHCHLSWHEALWALAAGDSSTLWRNLEEDVHPDRALAPPLNVLTDFVALLLRAELAGFTPPDGLWQRASDYALAKFPRQGLSFADAHAAIVQALCGRHEALEPLLNAPRGPAGDLVARLARAFDAWARQDWPTTIAELLPVLRSSERLGGSRAQRDLLELALAHALCRCGQRAEAERLLSLRRPGLGSAQLAALRAAG